MRYSVSHGRVKFLHNQRMQPTQVCQKLFYIGPLLSEHGFAGYKTRMDWQVFKLTIMNIMHIMGALCLVLRGG